MDGPSDAGPSGPGSSPKPQTLATYVSFIRRRFYISDILATDANESVQAPKLSSESFGRLEERAEGKGSPCHPRNRYRGDDNARLLAGGIRAAVPVVIYEINI